GELHLMVEPVEPTPQVWEHIKLKVGDIEPSSEIKLLEPEPQPASPAQTGLSEPAATEPAATESAVPEAAEAEPELVEPRSPERALRSWSSKRNTRHSAHGVGLARGCHGRSRLDHGGFEPAIAAAVAHAGGNSDAGNQRRTDQRHDHDLEMGHAVGGKHGGVV